MPTPKQARKMERHSRNVINVRFDSIKAGWETWVLLRSDAHHDNPKCDQKMEREHLEEAKSKNAVVIDNGDLFCAMQGKWDKRANKDAIRPEHNSGNYLDALVSTAADFYKPFNSIPWILGRGNHETAIRSHHETDLTDRLSALMTANNTEVFTSGYGGWVRFMFTAHGTRRSQYILHHYHGSGGGGPVTHGVIDANRIGIFTPDPDIILTGHSHTDWTLTVPRQRISPQGDLYHDEQVFVRVPGYKDAWKDGYGGWEVEKRHGPKPKGAAWLRFYLKGDVIKMDAYRAK